MQISKKDGEHQTKKTLRQITLSEIEGHFIVTNCSIYQEDTILNLYTSKNVIRCKITHLPWFHTYTVQQLTCGIFSSLEVKVQFWITWEHSKHASVSRFLWLWGELTITASTGEPQGSRGSSPKQRWHLPRSLSSDQWCQRRSPTHKDTINRHDWWSNRGVQLAPPRGEVQARVWSDCTENSGVGGGAAGSSDL